MQGRVSTDYLLTTDQWKIGISSLFAHALGVAPFKDTFWTTSDQPGNPRGKLQALYLLCVCACVCVCDLQHQYAAVLCKSRNFRVCLNFGIFAF